MLSYLVFATVIVGGLSAHLPKALVPMLDGRIVGGEDADIKELPYQISFQYYGSHICGGSIISERVIVTAAHCAVLGSASSFSIRAGSSSKSSGGKSIQVESLKIHPQYDSGKIDYDVALLYLAEPLEFDSDIHPITLCQNNADHGETAIVSGWGALKQGGSSPDTLQKVYVPVVENDKCGDAYGSSMITDRMMCAGLPEGGKDACQGDSGGPLVVNGKLCGIVSWGYGCAQPDYPGVYSNVAALYGWIADNS